MSQELILRCIYVENLVTLHEIAVELDLPRKRAQAFLGRMVRDGVVSRSSRGVYAITPKGAQAVVNGARMPLREPRELTGVRVPHKRTDRDRIWAQLRRARQVNIPDLVALLGCKEASAYAYLRQLSVAGVLRQLDRRKPGTALTSNGFCRWILLRDLGPRTPVWRPKIMAIFDPNSGETLHAGEVS